MDVGIRYDNIYNNKDLLSNLPASFQSVLLQLFVEALRLVSSFGRPLLYSKLSISSLSNGEAEILGHQLLSGRRDMQASLTD